MSPEGPCKVLVVGSGGQVGTQLVRLLAGRAVFSSRDRGLIVDLEHIAERRWDLGQQIESEEIDAIICVGGLTDVERCEAEPRRAFKVNAEGPAVLAGMAAANSASFVYFSTDYVFDGENGPYWEDSETDPISVYGESKLAGERAVQNVHPAPLVIRTTVVFGPDRRRKNFLYGLTAALRAGRPMRVASDQISTPTYSCYLASITLDMLALEARGIFNVVGPQAMSRYEFALRAASFLKLDSSLIVPAKTTELAQAARRPLKAGLRSGKVRKTYPSADSPSTMDRSMQHWEANEYLGGLP